jgi:hypothetical protein
VQAARQCRQQRSSSGSNGRQYKAAKRGKNARKHANRPTTQPQAQTPLKTLYTASAVQFTQAEHQHTKKRSPYSITIQKRKTVGKTQKKKACKFLAHGVL